MKNFLSVIFILALFLLFISPILATTKWSEDKISSIESKPSGPQIATGKVGYGVVWTDDRETDSELYFSLVNSGGNAVGKEVKITNNNVHDLTPSIVWNGEDYGVFWSYDKSQIYYTRVKEVGNKVLEEIPVVTTTAGYAIHVSAVWNGEEYGVVWWDARNNPGCTPSGTRGRAFFVRVSKDGQKIGDEIPVADEFSNTWQDYHPLIVWNGESYGVFWNDSREAGTCYGNRQNIYYSQVNNLGEKVLGDIKLQKADTGYSQLESVVWDDNNYAITYRGSVVSAYLAKMNKDGDTLYADIPINTVGFGGGAQISWNGENYFIAWGDGRDRTPDTFYNTEIYFTKFDTDGNKLIPETRVTYQNDPSNENTKIMFLHSKIGLAWKETRQDRPAIYFGSAPID